MRLWELKRPDVKNQYQQIVKMLIKALGQEASWNLIKDALLILPGRYVD